MLHRISAEIAKIHYDFLLNKLAVAWTPDGVMYMGTNKLHILCNPFDYLMLDLQTLLEQESLRGNSN